MHEMNNIEPQQFTPPEPFSAIIFDCDGTLVDTAPVYHRAYNAAVAPYGVEMPADWYVVRTGLSAEALLREFSREFGVQFTTSALLEPITDVYRQSLDELRVIEIVASVAQRYHGKVPMAVASAGTRDIVETTLSATGILPLFDAVVTVEDVNGRSKPAPDLFLEAARRLGVPPHECTVFEDTDEGIEAARRAGMTVTDVRAIHRHPWLPEQSRTEGIP